MIPVRCKPRGVAAVIFVYILLQASIFVSFRREQISDEDRKQDISITGKFVADPAPAGLSRSEPVNGRGLSVTYINMTRFANIMQSLAVNFTVIRGLMVRSRFFCEDTVRLLGRHSAVFRDVVLDNNYVFKRPKVSSDDSFDKNYEYPEIRRGFISLNPRCSFDDFRHLISLKGIWMRNWNSYIVQQETISLKSINQYMGIGVVIQRFEYENVYWTLIDLYNVYLAIRLQEQDPRRAAVIWADDHPPGNLDPVWGIFGGYTRLSEMNRTRLHVQFLIWMSHRESDHTLQRNLPIPLYSEFRRFVYKRFGCDIQHKNRCGQKLLNILVILRRNECVAEKSRRRMIRAFLNEDEILKAAKSAFFEHYIIGARLELMNISQQIKLISSVDILVGIHGAGLAYGALLQPGAAILELFPYRYIWEPNDHMESLARANGAIYRSWYNSVPLDEDKFDSIKIPPKQFVGLVRKTIGAFCHKNS